MTSRRRCLQWLAWMASFVVLFAFLDFVPDPPGTTSHGKLEIAGAPAASDHVGHSFCVKDAWEAALHASLTALLWHSLLESLSTDPVLLLTCTSIASDASPPASSRCNREQLNIAT